MRLRVRQIIILFLVLGFAIGSFFHAAMPVAASTELSYGACSSEHQESAGRNQGMAPCCAEKHQSNTDKDDAPLQGAVLLAPNSSYFPISLPEQGKQLSLLESSYQTISGKTIVLRI
jgi:hypothetical protein